LKRDGEKHTEIALEQAKITPESKENTSGGEENTPKSQEKSGVVNELEVPKGFDKTIKLPKKD
jgi:hypothetical protein